MATSILPSYQTRDHAIDLWEGRTLSITTIESTPYSEEGRRVYLQLIEERLEHFVDEEHPSLSKRIVTHHAMEGEGGSRDLIPMSQGVAAWENSSAPTQPEFCGDGLSRAAASRSQPPSEHEAENCLVEFCLLMPFFIKR